MYLSISHSIVLIINDVILKFKFWKTSIVHLSRFSIFKSYIRYIFQMSKFRTEQSSQTSSSLSSLYQKPAINRSNRSGFGIDDDEQYDDNEPDNDYDEVASNVSSLHYQLAAIEKRDSADAARHSTKIGFRDSIPQVRKNRCITFFLNLF